MTWGVRGALRPRTVVLIAVGVTLLAAGCRRDNVETTIDVPLPSNIRPCDEYYEEGKILNYSTEGDFGTACEAGGELQTPVPAVLRCQDGSGKTLLFNQYAWGYQNEEMHLFEPDDTLRLPPTQETYSCLSEAGDDVLDVAEEQVGGNDGGGGEGEGEAPAGEGG